MAGVDLGLTTIDGQFDAVDEARFVGAEEDDGIADVALEVGYLNSANFSTEFKKFWQKSPTQLRSECQADPQVLQNLVASKFR